MILWPSPWRQTSLAVQNQRAQSLQLVKEWKYFSVCQPPQKGSLHTERWWNLKPQTNQHPLGFLSLCEKDAIFYCWDEIFHISSRTSVCCRGSPTQFLRRDEWVMCHPRTYDVKGKYFLCGIRGAVMQEVCSASGSWLSLQMCWTFPHKQSMMLI